VFGRLETNWTFYYKLIKYSCRH